MSKAIPVNEWKEIGIKNLAKRESLKDRRRDEKLFQKERKNKYNAQKTIIDGIVFDSKKEGQRYRDLKVLERTKEITELELQPEFPIVVNETKVCKYIADFRYKKDGETIVEDVKSEMTRKLPVYRLKKKLVKAVHGIDIEEV